MILALLMFFSEELIARMFFWHPLEPAVAGPPRDYRVAHARELMGGMYDGSVVQYGERIPDTRAYVHRIVAKSLRSKWKHYSRAIARTIINESHRLQFDPLFVLAVISNESHFRPDAKGSHGEIGLMQIKPSTGKWLAKLHALPWRGKKTLYDPQANIRLGTSYLAMLRTQFNSQSRLYLSAYNMGSAAVLRASTVPSQYADRTMKYYIQLYVGLKHEGATA